MNTDDPEDRPARHPNRDDEADGLGGMARKGRPGSNLLFI